MECTICNRLQGRWGITTRDEAKTSQSDEPGVRSFIVQDIPWEKMKASAEDCYVCRLLVAGCRGCFSLHDIRDFDISHVDIHFHYPTFIERLGEAEAQKTIVFRMADTESFYVEFFATEDDDCPIPESWDYIPTCNRTSQRSDSAMALAKIKSWMAACTVKDCDAYCDISETPQMPTRVIDVGTGDGVVRLLETQAIRSKYICLSHCWGYEQIIKTTKSTFEERKKQIEWDALSTTFQDAITLTRSLGFRYIWIDSLCIIQDDARDWEIESAMMASVYSNGHLTIAATMSRDGRGGLFSRHGDFKVTGTTPEGEDYCLFFRERIDHQIDSQVDLTDSAPAGMGFQTGSDKHFPLLTRAWVYQERMLSARVLHFGRYEMFFECRSSIECECSLIQFQGTGFETVLPLVKIEYAIILDNYTTKDVRMGGSTYYQGARLWRTMVACYTALSLTKSPDRLPAIGGLARQMASCRQSSYLAGIWTDAISDDLLWYVHTTSKFKKRRPRPLNAPTWSWASVEATVSYWDEMVVTDLEGNAVDERLPYQHFATIESCEVTKSAIDEFGSISHGILRITGLLVEGFLFHGFATSDRMAGQVQDYFKKSDIQHPIGADYLLSQDGLDRIVPGEVIWCLRMSLYQQGSRECLFSLVLRKVASDQNIFERIGTLRISGPLGSIEVDGGIFNKASACTICIV